MTNILDDMQARIAVMIGSRALHTNGFVNEDGYVMDLEVKKELLWHLDLFAAAVAGARIHFDRVEADETYTEEDKAEVRARSAKRLKLEFKDLRTMTRNYFDCREDRDTPWSALIEETLKELDLLAQGARSAA